MILASTDWVGILTALGVLIPTIVAGTVKIIQAINSAHATASKAAEAADSAAKTAKEAAEVTRQIHKEIQLPSNGTTIGAATEGMAQVQHIAVNLQKPEEAPDIPSAIQVARDLSPNTAPERRENLQVPPLPPMSETIPSKPKPKETPTSG